MAWQQLKPPMTLLCVGGCQHLGCMNIEFVSAAQLMKPMCPAERMIPGCVGAAASA